VTPENEIESAARLLAIARETHPIEYAAAVSVLAKTAVGADRQAMLLAVERAAQRAVELEQARRAA
jgi:hypothetical protein